MSKSVLDNNPLVGVEGQHLLKKVESLMQDLVCSRKGFPIQSSVNCFSPLDQHLGRACSRESLACKAATAGNFEPSQIFFQVTHSFLQSMYLLVDNAVQIVRSGTSQDAKDVVQLKIHSEVFIAWEFKPSILTQTKFIELVTNS